MVFFPYKYAHIHPIFMSLEFDIFALIIIFIYKKIVLFYNKLIRGYD